MSKPPFVRLLKMGLQTLLGLKRQGFFIPYRYADQLDEMGTLAPYEPLLKMFEAKKEGHAAFISRIDGYAEYLEKIGATSPPGPRWGQDWFPRLDGAAACSDILLDRLWRDLHDYQAPRSRLYVYYHSSHWL